MLLPIPTSYTQLHMPLTKPLSPPRHPRPSHTCCTSRAKLSSSCSALTRACSCLSPQRSLTLLNSTTQHAFAPLSITIPSGLSSHNLSSTFITLCSSPCTSSSKGVLASSSATAARSSSLLQVSGYIHPSATVTPMSCPSPAS